MCFVMYNEEELNSFFKDKEDILNDILKSYEKDKKLGICKIRDITKKAKIYQGMLNNKRYILNKLKEKGNQL